MSNTEALITILDHLGGPRLRKEDIEWVADLPAGRDLLGFLASQVEFDGAVGLRDIALEREESELWQRAIQAKLVTADPPSFTTTNDAILTQTSSDYVIPSMLLSQADDIDEEQAILDHELKLLNGRIAKARSNTNVEKRVDKTISSAQKQTSLSISSLEGQLSELSEKTDSTLSSAVQSASQLALDLSLADRKDGQHSYQHVKELSMLLDAFTTISFNLNRLSSARFQRHPDDPLANVYVEALHAEAQRLVTAIRELEDERVAIAFEADCEGLDKGASLDLMLSTPGDPSPLQTENVEDGRWAEAIISQAWSTEQAADLRRRSDSLKQIADLLQDELLPPLTLIHASLSVSDASMEETLVAIQALVDELDDMEADLGSADDSPKPDQKHYPNHTLEGRIKDLLKHLRGSRPSDLPSLVVMERKDILSELSGVRARYDHALAEVTALSSAIPPDLLSLNASSRIYLSALTMHSPLTTAPPISLPLEVQHQECKARTQIAEVSRALGDMPNELSKDSRIRRKFDSFVETNR